MSSPVGGGNSAHLARKSVPWLTESTPDAWDAYARDGGPDHLVADCGSIGSHERRLRALLAIPLRTGDSVSELGCGTGRLADLLPAGTPYEGLDWSPEVLRLARRRRPQVTFRLGTDADLTRSDWVVASGPFNYESGWSKAQTAKAVQRMWEASRRGIAVTLLGKPAPGRLHYDPIDAFELVQKFQWGFMELDRSYLPNDLCLRVWRAQVMRKEPGL